MPKRLLGEVVAVALEQGQTFCLEDFDEYYRVYRLVMAHLLSFRLNFSFTYFTYEKSCLEIKNYKKME